MCAAASHPASLPALAASLCSTSSMSQRQLDTSTVPEAPYRNRSQIHAQNRMLFQRYEGVLVPTWLEPAFAATRSPLRSCFPSHGIAHEERHEEGSSPNVNRDAGRPKPMLRPIIESHAWITALLQVILLGVRPLADERMIDRSSYAEP